MGPPKYWGNVHLDKPATTCRIALNKGLGMKLSDPIFHNADAARQWLKAQRWPNGPICPHCGNSDPLKIRVLEGKANYRPGLYKCYAPHCRKQFSVTVNTVMERSHIPINLWVMAMFLMSNAKKSVSSRQMARMMDIPVKTAWFLTHRIREAMGEDNPSPLGGQNKVVESDESAFGGKAKNRAYKPEPKKYIVMTLVERDGRSRSFHIANATAKTFRDKLVYQYQPQVLSHDRRIGVIREGRSRVLGARHREPLGK
jgi:transposase-like protein